VPANAPAGVRAEIARQQRLDRHWGMTHTVLETRIGAVYGARRAVAAREDGAEFALRQALIDLASCCETIASKLPPPNAAA
jgi:hypothetical protein